ncbi:MAG: TetR/AcrR family transcriptional regulator [Bacteroidota bacterium]|jgi:AcrR family transcriptional regulator
MLSSFPQEKLDPRVRRTRELIQRSFLDIVEEKGFNSISVQDITARAGINRATFYAHFPDKFALLDYAIGEMFRAEIESRMLNVCEFRIENLRTLVITVCEFVGRIHSHTDKEGQYQTLAEAQIRNQVYGLILHWLEKIETIRNCSVSRERAATAASWAIYGLAHQWTHEKRKSSAETFADEVMPLVAANLGQTIEITG